MSGRALRAGSRIGVWALAALATVAALALLVVAADVLASRDGVKVDDARFQSAPQRQAGLWEVGRLPDDLTERLLGLEDDVDFRKLAALYVRVEPGKTDYRGFPELEAMRAKLQFELTRASRTDPDLERRSRLLTMYGVTTLDFPTNLSDEERGQILSNAASAFRNAITFDPANEDAKRNLETVLRVFGPVGLSGTGPTGGKSEGNVSGQGVTGSGY